MLETLNIVKDEEEAEPEAEPGLVRGGFVDEEDHIPTNERSVGGADGPGVLVSATQPTAQEPTGLPAHRMQNRGMPYFEEMVEDSRLGRIKRQKGGHTSRDGKTTVEWEVVEIGSDEPTPMETTSETAADGGSRNKRQRVDV